jgi:hypothetical protein
VICKGSIDGMRAYQVGRSRVDLEGNVLAIAAYLHRNGVDANVKEYIIHQHAT